MNAKLRPLMLLAACVVGSLSLSSCKEEEQEEFGFTCIELGIGEAVDGDPFAGTYRIKATMFYEPCLIDYYEKNHPEQRADGPADAGGAVFAEWKDRLCTENVERRIDCEIEGFEQNLNSGGSMPLYNMTVSYLTPNPDQLNGRRLLWGPAPLEAYAECDAGLRPFVKLTGLTDVVGFDAQDNPLWSLQSFGQTPRGLISQAGTGCLQVPVSK